MESNTTEASRLALSYAMDLAERAQGQPWGADPIVAAAQKFREFLTWEPEPPTRSLTPPPSKRAATNTTPPDPEPVDF